MPTSPRAVSAPVTIGRVLVGVATIIWVVVGLSYLRGIRAHRVALAGELADPIAGPFASLAVITPMLAGADALYPLNHMAGTVVVDMLVVATVVLAGWFTGRLSFMPSFWAFTFSWAAVTFAGLSWLGVTHPTGWRAESYVALALISVFVGAIAGRTVLAVQRGQFLPTHGPAAASAAVSPALPGSTGSR